MSHKQVNLEGERVPEIQLSSPKRLDGIQTVPKAHTTRGSCRLFAPFTEQLLISKSWYFLCFCHHIFLTPSPPRELYPHALTFHYGGHLQL